MAENTKRFAPNTSKQTESEEQDLYDLDKVVQVEFSKAGIKPDSTDNDKNVIFVMAKGNMQIGGYHASGSSRMFNNSEVKSSSRSELQSVQNNDSKSLTKSENIKNIEFTLGGLLKRGTFGDVYVIQDKKDSELYVLRVPREKEYGSHPDAMDSETTLYTQEIEVQKELQEKSRYILNFVREFYFRDRRGFIFEYCTFGSLKNVLNKLRSENMDMNPFLTCRIFKQVSDAISFLHAKDRNSHRVTHNDVNHKSIYLTEDLDARLGSFGRATKALRTESRSESTDASHSHVAYAGFFLSERRHADPRRSPSKSDDVFSLGACVYAALVDVGTRPRKFYEICKQNFDVKYRLVKKVARVGEEYGGESAECELALHLMEVIETCCLAGGEKKVEAVWRKFSTQARELVGSGAADVLKNILQESTKPKIEDVCLEFTTRTRLFPEFEEAAFEAAEELKRHLERRSFHPDDTWEPITSLNEKF